MQTRGRQIRHASQDIGELGLWIVGREVGGDEGHDGSAAEAALGRRRSSCAASIINGRHTDARFRSKVAIENWRIPQGRAWGHLVPLSALASLRPDRRPRVSAKPIRLARHEMMGEGSPTNSIGLV